MFQRALIIFFLLSFSLASAQITNVRKWRKSEVDSLDQALFLYDEKMFEQACPLFEGILKNHPKEEFIKYSFAKCALYRSDKHEEAYLLMTELYPKYNDIPDMKYDIALGALYNLRFDEAEEYVEKFLATKRLSLQDKRKADVLKKNIYYARYFSEHPTSAKVTNLGSNINGPGDEYVPAITADDSLMVFTYIGENSVGGRQNEYLQPDPKGFYMEDLYVSHKKNGEFTKAQPIDSLNTNLPDAAISLSMDGRLLFMYQNIDDGHGDIYASEWNGDHYTKPKKLKGLNSYSWDGHCTLAPDGKTLYFSSERVGGYGGRDIYRAELLPDSTWGNISNLGDSINTRYDEDSPFIHPDGQTLFFSSKGHSSMGGYDIFRTSLNPQDSAFSLPVENLGWPINSTDDDIYFILAADGKTGYYSSGRKGGFGLKDIYEVKPEFSKPVNPVYLVKGTVRNNGNPIETQIALRNLNTNSEISVLRSHPGDGTYLTVLPNGSKYGLTFNYNSKPSKTIELDLTHLDSYKTSVMNIDVANGKDSLLAPAISGPLAANTKSPVPAAAPSATASKPSSTGSVAVTSSTLASTTAISANSAGNPDGKTGVSGAVVVAATSAGTSVQPKKTESKAIDNFVPKTKYQEKTMRYVEKYGDISAEGLVFRVQFAAFKTGKNFSYPELAKIGRIERMMLGDSYTRLTIGGSFKTLKAAFATNKKVVNAGETEAFIVIFYKEKRTTFEELEKQKIFVVK